MSSNRFKMYFNKLKKIRKNREANHTNISVWTYDALNKISANNLTTLKTNWKHNE